MKFTVLKNLALLLGVALAAPAVSQAAVLYSQNFEPPVPTSSATAGPAGFVQTNDISDTDWQAQGGGGGGGITQTAGVDTNGVGGSQALFVNNNHSTATDFTFNQYTVYGAVGAAGVTANNVQIEMDLFMSGSESANDPIGVVIQNNGADLTFKPVLSNGSYTHVSFLLSQASNVGSFSPAAGSNLRLEHGAGGFGFDANNMVRVDNILIQTIPEPTTPLLCGLAALCIAGLRRSPRT